MVTCSLHLQRDAVCTSWQIFVGHVPAYKACIPPCGPVSVTEHRGTPRCLRVSCLQ